ISQDGAGFVVSNNEPWRLADKIGVLLLKPRDGIEAARSIRATVAKFSWVNIADEMVERYRVVLRNYGASPG
ncbi:MAG: hypothetical protein PHN78_06375, partial [Dehalococcoidales bacterium]|nr:hypothetical protein [Dehalococcoidales bacterium]